MARAATSSLEDRRDPTDRLRRSWKPVGGSFGGLVGAACAWWALGQVVVVGGSKRWHTTGIPDRPRRRRCRDAASTRPTLPLPAPCRDVEMGKDAKRDKNRIRQSCIHSSAKDFRARAAQGEGCCEQPGLLRPVSGLPSTCLVSLRAGE